MWTIHENRQKLSILVLFWHFFEIFGKPLSGSSGRKPHLKGRGAMMSVLYVPHCCTYGIKFILLTICSTEEMKYLRIHSNMLHIT